MNVFALPEPLPTILENIAWLRFLGTGGDFLRAMSAASLNKVT
ncbi:MAG: hypothetical protein ACM3JC_06880 [Rudaea sp.]